MLKYGVIKYRQGINIINISVKNKTFFALIVVIDYNLEII